MALRVGGSSPLSHPQLDLPYPTLFNHVLVLVEEPGIAQYYIDPQLKGYDLGEYPFSYQRAYTFVITEDGGRFDRLPEFGEDRYSEWSERLVNVDADGSALVELKNVFDLDLSIKFRKIFNSFSKEEKEKFEESLRADISGGNEMLDHKMEGLEKRYGRIKSYSKLKMENRFLVTKDTLVVDITPVECELSVSTAKRQRPLFWPVNSLKKTKFIYRLPAEYRIVEMPQNLNLDIGFYQVNRQYKKNGNEVVVSEVERYRRMELPAEEYARVKNFLSQLPLKTTQRIILRKKKSWFKR